MNPLHPSNSATQTQAETLILQALNLKSGLELVSAKRFPVANRHVQIDGYDEENGVLCEIVARQGALKSAQRDKVASDILKMILVEKLAGVPMRKIICFASTDASAAFTKKSWLALSAQTFGIEIETVKLDAPTVLAIEAAQTMQHR